ncbi:hypothetical protein HGRIS_005983 [Hohenbuehelia grisea]|uniref:P/Homo B domain-containing protein n=1 Tax=Hohenbuehelia grisea TaxID=104357 RepID=A0ABR3JYR9_9AGAR
MAAVSATKAMRPMRIIAMPLTRPSALTAAGSSRVGPPHAPLSSEALLPSLTLYHFDIKARSRRNLKSPDPSTSTTQTTSWLPEEGVVKWATNKAAQAWTGFGKAKEGSWKLRVYTAGERLVDRLEFEELALKAIDPSLGPSITHPDFSGKDSTKAKTADVVIPLYYPPSIHSGSAARDHLRAMVVHRTPKHRKGFYMWMFLSPLTAPFMIIRMPLSFLVSLSLTCS